MSLINKNDNNMVILKNQLFEIDQLNFLIRKQKFYNCNLIDDDFNFVNKCQYSQKNYIEHYPRQNWKNNISRIPLCKYDFSSNFLSLKKELLKYNDLFNNRTI